MASTTAAQTAPATARPESRPHCWLWARPLPLERVPDALVASKLPPKSALVLAALSGHERRWRRVQHEELAERMGLTTRQVSRRVRALRDAGLVDVSVRRTETNVYDLVTGAARPGHGTSVWLRPRASCAVPREGHTGLPVLYVPGEVLQAMRERNSRGGKRPGAGRPRKSNRRLTSAAGAANPADLGGGPDDPEKSNRRILESKDLRLEEDKESTSPEGKGSVSPAPPGGDSFLPGEEDATGFDPDSVDLSGPGQRRRPLPADLRGPRPEIPELDRPAVRYPGLRVRVPEPTPLDLADPERMSVVRELQVQCVARGYEQALRKIYGDDRRFYAKDVTRMRAYPALVAAAELLCEHDVPPGEWAEWRLELAKNNGEEPWPLTRVFQAKTIERLRGFFRRSFKSSPEAKQDWRPYHDEQRHRAREAELLWAWGEDPPMLSFPKPYTEMRARERRLGPEYADPLYNWPSPRNGGGR